MMGKRVQIARQDTLLEVQTTGTQTKNTLDVVNGKIGNLGDTAEEGTLFGQMAGGSGSTGTVKSVQRGHITAVKTGGVADVTINTVNPEKCICTVIGGYRSSDFRPAVIKEFSSTKLKIITLGMTSATNQNIAIYWEVAEFY